MFPSSQRSQMLEYSRVIKHLVSLPAVTVQKYSMKGLKKSSLGVVLSELRKALIVENVSRNHHFSLAKLNEPAMGSQQFVQQQFLMQKRAALKETPPHKKYSSA